MTNDKDRRRQIDELAEQLISEAGGINGLLASLGVAPGFVMPELKQPELLPQRQERVAYVLRMELDDIAPPIWRQVRVPSDLTLERFHDVMQAVMGWTDTHLHAFLMGPGGRPRNVAPFLTAYEIEEGQQGVPEDEVRLDEVLAEVGDRLYYDYDFGDNWEHTVTLEAVEPWADGGPELLCLAGERACPLEDVGGVHGHEGLLDVCAGRTRGHDPEWVEMIREWLPQGYAPEHFDPDEANAALGALEWPVMEGWMPDMLSLLIRASAASPVAVRQLAAAVDGQELASDDEVGEAVADLLLLLEAVGSDGIKLTQAGYLPPKLVKELFGALTVKLTRSYPFAPSTEANTKPVLWLRATATALGLVRKLKGSLVLTRKGRDAVGHPERVWQAVVDAVPLGTHDYEIDAGLVAIFSLAAGRRSGSEGAQLFLDSGWDTDGPMDLVYLRASEKTRALLRVLGNDAGVAARLIRVV